MNADKDSERLENPDENDGEYYEYYDDDDDDDDDDTTCLSSNGVAQVRDEFAKLSTVLAETNQNLTDFESMLDEYKSYKSPSLNVDYKPLLIDVLTTVQKIASNHRNERSDIDELVSLRSKCGDLEFRIQRQREELDSKNKRIQELESRLINDITYEERLDTISRTLNEERRLRLETELKLKTAVTRHKEYESQLSDLKSGLVQLQNELIDSQKDIRLESSLKDEISKNEEIQNRFKETDAKLKRLRTKSKWLLKQYRSKKGQLRDKERTLTTIKTSLSKLRLLCTSTEANYRYILFHLGGQIEIMARLLAAYLNVKCRKTISSHDSGLRNWFCDIQALSLWVQNQLVAFGVRYWTGKEDPTLSHRILLPCKEQSEQEEQEKESVLRAISSLTEESKFEHLFSQIVSISH